MTKNNNLKLLYVEEGNFFSNLNEARQNAVQKNFFRVGL